jgi:hypothetical protein
MTCDWLARQEPESPSRRLLPLKAAKSAMHGGGFSKPAESCSDPIAESLWPTNTLRPFHRKRLQERAAQKEPD